MLFFLFYNDKYFIIKIIFIIYIRYILIFLNILYCLYYRFFDFIVVIRLKLREGIVLVFDVVDKLFIMFICVGWI